eukprot:scaffold50397_cov65-Cyclotella_meneghiniana.AAC.2
MDDVTPLPNSPNSRTRPKLALSLSGIDDTTMLSRIDCRKECMSRYYEFMIVLWNRPRIVSWQTLTGTAA